jgi:hypothetical protein
MEVMINYNLVISNILKKDSNFNMHLYYYTTKRMHTISTSIFAEMG